MADEIIRSSRFAELGFRVAADLPIPANRDHVEARPGMAGKHA